MSNGTALVVLATAILLRPTLRLLIEGPVTKDSRAQEKTAAAVYTLIGVLCLMIGMVRLYGGGGAAIAGLITLGIPALAHMVHEFEPTDPAKRHGPEWFVAFLIATLGALAFVVGLVVFMFGG